MRGGRYVTEGERPVGALVGRHEDGAVDGDARECCYHAAELVQGELRVVDGEDHLLLRGGVFFFFFQAEDGIRDKLVTGVQTCALPICPSTPRARPFRPGPW